MWPTDHGSETPDLDSSRMKIKLVVLEWKPFLYEKSKEKTERYEVDQNLRIPGNPCKIFGNREGR